MLFFIFLYGTLRWLFGAIGPCYANHHPTKKTNNSPNKQYFRNRKKPKWVRQKIIRIKALMPEAGCRTIALIFNNEHVERETVGKTFVSTVLRQHRYEIQILQKKLKNRPTHHIPFNKVWGMDLCFIQQQPTLGVIEHHSRKAIGLIPLRQKSTVMILKVLLNLLEHYPAPAYIRTDNEACFNSKLMRTALAFWASSARLLICIAPGRMDGLSDFLER